MALQSRRGRSCPSVPIILSCLRLWFVCKGMVQDGVLPTDSDYGIYVGKFCFDFDPNIGYTPDNPEVGHLNYSIWWEGSAQPKTPQLGDLYFLIFDDEAIHWNMASRNWATSTCQEKVRAASTFHKIRWDDDQLRVGRQIHIRERYRPRFWYFTFVSCGTQLPPGAYFRYKLHATNPRSGEQAEFSVDQRSLLRLFSISTGLFALLMFLAVWASHWRSSARAISMKDHPLIQLLLLSLMCSLVSCSCALFHYSTYQRDGYGSQRIRFLGALSGIVSNCTVFLIAILSSVGWSITTHSLPHRREFFFMVLLVGLLNAACELNGELQRDQSTKLYTYESPVGIFVLFMKIGMFCFFASHIKQTCNAESQLRLRYFYTIFGFSFMTWSLSVPVTVILAFAISPWWRFKVVTNVDVVSRFVGQMLLTQLLCGPLSPVTKDNIFPAKVPMPLEEALDPLTKGSDIPL